MIRLYSGAMSIVLRRILLRFADTSRLLVMMAPSQLHPYPSTSSKTSVYHCYRLHLIYLDTTKHLNNTNQSITQRMASDSTEILAMSDKNLPRIFSGSRPRSNPCSFFSSGVFFLADVVLSPGTGLTPFRFLPISSFPMHTHTHNYKQHN